MTTPQPFQTVSRRPPDIEDYIDMLRRYRSWIIAPMFAGLVISVVAAFLYPDTYRSYAMLRITPPTVPEQLIPAVAYSQMSEWIMQTRTQILSRTTLEEIIRKPALELYKKQWGKVPMEDIIQDMKNNYIHLDLVYTGADHRVPPVLQISFDYSDKYKAQQVVRELVNRFMEQNTTFQTDQVKLANRFIDEEVKAAKDRMDHYEQELTRFKMANNGKLPEQVQSNTQAIFQLQMQSMQAQQNIDRDEQEIAILNSDLNNNKAEQSFQAANLETVIPGQTLTVSNQKLINLNAQITTVRSQLAQLQNFYGPNYPEIGNLKAQLASLEKQQGDLEAEENAQAAAAAANTPQSKRVVNPAVQQRLQELKATQNSIQTRMATKQAEIQSLTRSKAEYEKQMGFYQKRIDEAPANEQQYAALLQDLQLAKQGYQEMMKKHEMSQTAQNLEEHKAGESLDQLDPPNLPDKPIKPNRWAWAGIGTLAGLICGLALAGAKEVKNTSLKNLKDVRAYTNLPVLSSVPLLENALLLRRKRRLVWLAWSTGLILGCAMMLSSVYFWLSERV